MNTMEIWHTIPKQNFPCFHFTKMIEIVTDLECFQNMSEGSEELGWLDHERGPASACELEYHLRVGDSVELCERPDEDGGAALGLQHVRVPLRHHGPDQVRLRP